MLVKSDEESAWKKEGTVVAADPEIALIWSILQLGVCAGTGSISRSFLDLTGSSLVVLAVADAQLLLHLPKLHATPQQLEATSHRSQFASGKKKKYACTDATISV